VKQEAENKDNDNGKQRSTRHASQLRVPSIHVPYKQQNVMMISVKQ